ncbi:hypothetical protein ACIQZB_25375 [Streptomyces sp. NPDC097727]|uniref:IS1096 element passenger TnpR family protein n=1 Tax=Streptomyces sp. NPDC097727 TaxID=3366092 RepID=UPI003806AA06
MNPRQQPQTAASGAPAYTVAPVETVHQLRVSMPDIEPVVWRRIHVHSRTPLPRLHAFIQVAVGTPTCTSSAPSGRRTGTAAASPLRTPSPRCCPRWAAVQPPWRCQPR